VVDITAAPLRGDCPGQAGALRRNARSGAVVVDQHGGPRPDSRRTLLRNNLALTVSEGLAQLVALQGLAKEVRRAGRRRSRVKR
jgi:hypothetical protein